MKQEEIVNIVNKVYPLISEDYTNINPKVELHENIYERLNSISAMDEEDSYAEYDWSNNTIYIYTSRMKCDEDIIRSLIHECVHSTQSKEMFDFWYENGYTYKTHPFEIYARKAEENWKEYVFAEFDRWYHEMGEKNGYTEY